MKQRRIAKKCISLLLVIAIMLSLIGCSGSHSAPALSNPNSPVYVEYTDDEEILYEDTLDEFIAAETYLSELSTAEDYIEELLLTENTIDEVVLCRTFYISEDHIEEFSENSLTAQLFGDDVKIASLLKKVSVGTGVVLTLCVLKCTVVDGLVGSVVAAAADESLPFAASGAVAGSIFGGMTGAVNEIDESGRLSSVIGFAMATAGLVLSIVSLAGVIPSAGSTTITASAGLKLVIAGIAVAAAAHQSLKAGYDAVKTFTATDASDIDWENIDWRSVGVSAAEEAVSGSANGYMWGAVIGMIHGGAEGFDYYQKFNAPYTKKEYRLSGLPKNGSGGRWTGDRGESYFVLDEPLVLQDGTIVTKVLYQNAVPDFSPYQLAQVKIPRMTNERYSDATKGIIGNFEQADQVLAEYWTKIRYNRKSWTASEIASYRVDNDLTWHELSNMESMQLVPWIVNAKFPHRGGCIEYKFMLNPNQEAEFD